MRNESRSGDIPQPMPTVTLLDKQFLCSLSEYPDMNTTINSIFPTIKINTNPLYLKLHHKLNGID